jgi:hypothetical protein
VRVVLVLAGLQGYGSEHVLQLSEDPIRTGALPRVTKKIPKRARAAALGLQGEHALEHGKMLLG